MRVVFAGTPEFARVALERLLRSGAEIPLVLTQPDRAAGRGMKLQASPVKQFALQNGIPVAQPRSLRLDGKFPQEATAAKTLIDAANADVMVVAAYGLILPQWVLDATRAGGLNIHASLLPRWRGAAPIHRAIEAGDRLTGVTIMQMDAGLDTGDMLLSESLPIADADTTASLHDKLARLGADLIVQALDLLASRGLRPTAQPAAGVSYAYKIEKIDAAVDWYQPAALIARRVRAFNPFPVVSMRANNELIKIWNAEVDSESINVDAVPGTVLSANDAGITVQCGQGVLRLTELQRAGARRLPVIEFLRGFSLTTGTVLSSGRGHE